MTQWNIDIRAARHIVTLAKHLSFTQAAEELKITQSALSRSIQRFEKSVDLRLFDRTRGSVHLTIVGKEIVKRAMALIREADHFERALHQSAEGLQESVVLGMGHLPAKALLPQVIAPELADSPALHFRVLVRSSDTLLSLLLLDEIEFFICADRLVPEEAPVRRFKIGSFAMGHLVRPGHPLLDSAQQRQPHEFPWIVTQKIGDQSPASDQSLLHLRGKPRLEIEDLDCLAWTTQNSDAIWVTSQATATRELQAGTLCELPAELAHPGDPIKVVMYSRSDRSLSPAALRLRDKFRAAANAQ